jgi:tRNA pseudouridine32 synthase / 23S rRNA pseudouridine746 synthase
MPSQPLKQEYHLEITDTDQSLVDQLSEACSLSHQIIKATMDKGAVWLTRGKQGTRRIRRVKTQLHAGDQLHLYYDSNVLSQQVAAAQLIADEGDYSLWYKPYGMYSQGSKWGDHCTILRSVEKQTQRNAFITHRLDRAAQGLMLIAHSKRAAAALSGLFRERQIHKTYQAVVQGLWQHGPDSLRIDTPIDDKPAVSHIRSLEQDLHMNRSLLEITIETGRKHQIRRHLAELDYPIVGDRLHGQAQDGDSEDLQLCSCTLAFDCPISQQERHYSLPPYLRPTLQT